MSRRTYLKYKLCTKHTFQLRERIDKMRLFAFFLATSIATVSAGALRQDDFERPPLCSDDAWACPRWCASELREELRACEVLCNGDHRTRECKTFKAGQPIDYFYGKKVHSW
ncbi:hypothetical protein ACN47E_001591 [Coniothyrium glycines]